ncbi:DUF2971 domain-containing protein [Maribacter flavus]|uniref:DUF2971 domain-containing protein n=1 Tax=Maribacter flavus TaxID=1658664 RepID=A0A5B2TMQ5_9FLAO|nr:DUF2971 domain-containing protein [Maribacter flavus]KAA2215747.1 DUF2971 domain-containing protein [Maribacter flavus]
MGLLGKKWNTYHTKGIRKKYVFRYMDEAKVTSFLELKALYMPAMYRFDDKLEGISTYDITEVRTGYDICFVDNEKEINPKMLADWRDLKTKSKKKLSDIGHKLKLTQSAHYVSCWFNSDRESDGMWRFYARENGFAVKIDRKVFQRTIKDSVESNINNKEQRVVVGRIKYQDYPRVIENEQDNTVLYLAFRKDESFAHENEYRVVVIDTTNTEDKQGNLLYKLENFDDLPISIIIHPAMNEGLFRKYKKQFESFGNNITVRKSELEPFYQFYDRLKD